MRIFTYFMPSHFSELLIFHEKHHSRHGLTTRLVLSLLITKRTPTLSDGQSGAFVCIYFVVEDVTKVANLLKARLEQQDYCVDIAADANQCLNKVRECLFNLIIMDLMLPGKDGLMTIRELHGMGIETQILCLTARDNEHDVTAELNCGADDYLKKLFTWDELEARCRALIRRSLTGKGAKLYYADLYLDPVKHRAWKGCREVDLTHKEYRLLEIMMRHPETVLIRRSIAAGTWEAQKINFTNIIDVYVNYLRKKIDADRSEKLIHTIRGQGYMLSRISSRQ